MNFKKLISRFIFWLAILLLSLVAIMILAVELAPFANNYLYRHQKIVENWAQRALDQPIQIGSVDIIQKGITPVIQFKNVTIFNDARTEILAKVPQMQIGIDVYKSITKLRIMPNILYVSGAHFTFYKNRQGNIYLISSEAKIATEAIETRKKSPAFDDILEWLFTQKEIYLKDIIIDWRSDTSSLTCKLASLHLYPGPEISQAKGIAKKLNTLQKIPANLSFKIEMPKKGLQFNSKDENKKLVDWLNQAFISKANVSGSISLYGLLGPSNNQNKKFLLAIHLKNADLNYYPKWPMMEKLDTNIFFDGNSLHIVANAGQIGNIPFNFIDVKIPDLKHPVLVAKGKLQTQMENGFDFIKKSPLKDSVGANLKSIALSGPLNLNLDLTIPLTDEDKNTKVAGEILLQNNSLYVSRWNLEVKDLLGNVSFTMNDLVAPALTGILLSQKTNFNIKTLHPKDSERVTEVNISGAIDSQDLVKNLLNESLKTFAKNISGFCEYHAKLELPNNQTEQISTLRFYSNLYGVNVDLPLPLKKEATKSIPLELICKFKDSVLDNMTITYGEDFKAELLRNNKLKQSLLKPHEVAMMINASKLSWSDWYDFLKNHSEDEEFKIQSLSDLLLPSLRQITINVREFNVIGQTLRPAKIDIKLMPELKNLILRIDSSNIKGNVTIMYDQIRTIIKGQFAKLFLQASDKDLTNLNPKDLPTLSISSSDFHYNNKNYGRLTLETTPVAQGLKINSLYIKAPVFTLDATGSWFLKNGQQTMLHGQLDVDNLGKLLREMSMGENVENGKGRVIFDLTWQKSFFSPDINTMNGSMQLKFNSGEVVHLSKSAEAGLGLGRFFSLLSLQSLPKRLSLNFSDLTTKGFSFDELHGTLKINNGNVFTDDTHLEGVVAHVNAKGRIGLVAKDYDLILTTVPHITSSLPIVATIVGGPVAGAATWLADKILSRPVRQVTGTTYAITGSWARPNIIKTSMAKGRI